MKLYPCRVRDIDLGSLGDFWGSAFISGSAFQEEEAKEEATEEWDFDPSSVRWFDVSQTEGGGRLNLTEVTELDPLARCQILRRKKGPWIWSVGIWSIIYRYPNLLAACLSWCHIGMFSAVGIDLPDIFTFEHSRDTGIYCPSGLTSLKHTRCIVLGALIPLAHECTWLSKVVQLFWLSQLLCMHWVVHGPNLFQKMQLPRFFLSVLATTANGSKLVNALWHAVKVMQISKALQLIQMLSLLSLARLWKAEGLVMQESALSIATANGLHGTLAGQTAPKSATIRLSCARVLEASHALTRELWSRQHAPMGVAQSTVRWDPGVPLKDAHVLVEVVNRCPAGRSWQLLWDVDEFARCVGDVGELQHTGVHLSQDFGETQRSRHQFFSWENLFWMLWSLKGRASRFWQRPHMLMTCKEKHGALLSMRWGACHEITIRARNSFTKGSQSSWHFQSKHLMNSSCSSKNF